MPLRPGRMLAAMTGAALAGLAGPAGAQESAEELAKKLSNPVSSLISVPFQENVDFGLGPDGDGLRSLLNIQPVIPISISERWNVISRTILPLVYLDGDVAPGAGSRFGTGDTLQSLFLSPKDPGPAGLIWGVGPVFLLDTASDGRLGASKWGAGPTAVVLRQEGPWTIGLLANHVWSFAGDGDRSDVDSTFLQPFLAYTTQTAFTLTLNSESTYDWEANEWTVPLNLVASQVVRVGSQRFSLGVGGRYYADAPAGGPEWGLRFVVTLLFPK